MIDFYRQHLQEIKPSTGGWHTARCPFHEDNRSSFTFEAKTGNWSCHAGCGKGSVKDFAKRLNVEPPANGRSKDSSGSGHIVKIYDYVDESGKLVSQAVRYEPKDFRQRRPDGKDGFINNLQGIRLVPFNLPEVLKADTIYISEGEKDCEALAALGLTASCNPMGAGKWREEYNQYFKDKTIIILPDNDDAGRKHAEQVASNLQDVAASIKIVTLPSLPDKGDVSDWLAAGGTLEELQKLVDAQPAEGIKETLIISPTTDWLLVEPPPQDFIFNSILLKGTTGEIHAVGGTGKGFTFNAFVFSMTTGAELWSVFTPARSFKVLYLTAEDSEDILWRRLYWMAKDLTPDERNAVQQALDKNLILVAGQPLPLLELKDGNPVESVGFGELMALVNKHTPDVLILDPKSMFYGGLDENSNSHNTAFVSCLKKFNQLGVTVLFSHHESKALGGQGSQFSSRGGQALSDGVRWQVALSAMTADDANKYGVDAADYIKVQQTKSNYTKFFEPFFLKRGEYGVLDRADLRVEHYQKIIDATREIVGTGCTCTIHSIHKASGKDFRNRIKEMTGATIMETEKAIKEGLEAGVLSVDANGYLCTQSAQKAWAGYKG